MTTTDKTSLLINSQVPFFVRNDHQGFVTFLEAYYEYLEQNGKLTERSKNLRTYVDVDKTLPDFAERIYSHFLALLPKDALADRNIIVKNVLDFYRARGTEKALKFLLRILVGEEAEIYYPKRDILRVSDGKWFIQKSLRISPDTTDIDGAGNTSYQALQAFVSTRITGNTSNASAIVEKVDRFIESGITVDELILSSIHGDFESGETIRTNFREGDSVKFITSNVFSGALNSIRIVDGGHGYAVGDYVIFSNGSGSGANASVSQVTDGNVSSLIVLTGGTGFRAGDITLFSGGGGSGANGVVVQVDNSGAVHSNTYNILYEQISLVASVQLNAADYVALNHGIISSPNVNTRIIDACRQYVYNNTGPATVASVTSPGVGYTSTPSVAVVANTHLQQLGILGKMTIVAGGLGYARGTVIQILNVPGGRGTGAQANVFSNAANGMITGIRFESLSGNPPGGTGYDSSHLPTANVISSVGSGASVRVDSILGSGDTWIVGTGSFGTVLAITINDRGFGYTSAPDASLAAEGNADAVLTSSITTGIFEYPGRYLTDDGFVSSFNFLQDRDYYQNYSYVVRVKESLVNYAKAVRDLLHPAGMKLFGEYLYGNEQDSTFINAEASVRAKDNAAITWTGNASNILGGTTNYMTMVANTGNIANGHLVIAVSGEWNSNVNVTNMFVNNVEAKRLVANSANDGFQNYVGIYTIRGHTANTAFVNVKMQTAGSGNVAITAYRVAVENTMNSLTVNSWITLGTPISSNIGLKITGNGSALIITNFNAPTQVVTWQGATEVDDIDIGVNGAGALRHSTAVSYNIGANTTITATANAALTRLAIAGVSWMIGV